MKLMQRGNGSNGRPVLSDWTFLSSLGGGAVSLRRILGLVIGLTCFVEAVAAHEAFYPLAADSVEVSDDGFSLEVTGQEAIVVGQLHDPDETITGVVVLGTGEYGGSTGFMTLDPTLWSYDADATEWRYSNPIPTPSDRENRCVEAKVKTASRTLGCRARVRAGAYRDGATPDYSTCDARLAEGFYKAHRRYGADCPSEEDLVATQLLVAATDADLESLCGELPDTSDEVNSKSARLGRVCSAKRAEAQRRLERCSSRQEKRLRKGKKAKSLRCERRFSRRMARIESRYEGECPAASPVEEIVARTDDALADLYAAIRSGGETDDSSSGGITSVVIRPGSLSISGSGPEWSWDAQGSQESIWVFFRLENEWFCSEFSDANATIVTDVAGAFAASDATAPGSCLSPICGNGVVDEGSDEECDDGNLDDTDSCRNTCEENQCVGVVSADSTFDAIQEVIFNNYCVECHSSAYPGGAAGQLDLSPGVSYAAVYDQPSVADPSMKLVLAGESKQSLLWEKVAAKTLGISTVLSSMPPGNQTVSAEHLEAMQRWILGGAPEDLTVEGTADLLETCLPAPDPLKLSPVPPPPPPELGVQLQQTAWPLHKQSEDELCMATYYDFSNIIPPEHQLDCPQNALGRNVNNPSGKCFYYDETVLAQDPQSHHSIIKVYTGETLVTYSDEPQCANANAPADVTNCYGVDALCDSSVGAEDGECVDPNEEFGPWTYKPNYPDAPDAKSGACDPMDIDSRRGYNPDCSGAIVSGVACTGYGPQDAFQAPSFGGSQEAYSRTKLAGGVFRILPIAGLVIWNSHAFNLTGKDTTMAQYLDLLYGESDNRLYYGRGIFDASKIFVQQVPPFETREYCQTYTVPKNARVFGLSSHTHLRGVRFRIWAPPNPVCTLKNFLDTQLVCEDTDGDTLADCGCGPGPEDQLIYYSTSYTDPVALVIEPPMVVGPTVEERTFLYCSLYDNGSGPNSPPVKRQSTSPTSPPFFLGDFEIGTDFNFGGPCPNETTPLLSRDVNGAFGWIPGVSCMDNTDKKGQFCYGDDSLCDSELGAADGVCDACYSMGGFTTEDEMYILLGSYYIGPPPDETESEEDE